MSSRGSICESEPDIAESEIVDAWVSLDAPGGTAAEGFGGTSRFNIAMSSISN